jgi:hypothetical protein
MPTPPTNNTQSATGVLLASLLLPGFAALSCIAPAASAAENAPEKATVAIKLGSYSDSQPGWERITGTTPQVYVQAPIAGDWAIEASAAMDSVSGATPRWHTQHTELSGASQMNDVRRAGDVKVTRYLSRAVVSVSVARSSENDYISNALGLDARWSSEDNNHIWSASFGHASDRIDTTSTGGSAVDRQKTTNEFMAGLTQVLTADDIAQFNLTRSLGSGYYSDPYKTLDQRPSQRDAWIALARWNHYLGPFGASLRSSYRYYSDTFGVQSHTVGLDWVQPAGNWTVTPGARYYSQGAANFYLDPILDVQGQYDQLAVLTRAAKSFGSNQSTDQRLAAFGAVTLSFKLSYAFTPDTSADIRFDTYRQTAGLHLGGNGSPGLDPFKATFTQIGLTHRF